MKELQLTTKIDLTGLELGINFDNERLKEQVHNYISAILLNDYSIEIYRVETEWQGKC